MRERRRRHLAVLSSPEGAAGRTRGRKPQEGDQAEGHPSFILFDYFVCSSDLCLKIVTPSYLMDRSCRKGR